VNAFAGFKPLALWLLLPLAWLAGLPAGAGATTESLSYADLARRIIDLERLAVLPEAGETAGQASSFDRQSTYTQGGGYQNWSANADGDGIIRTEAGKQVLAELTGPGCIWRIWSAWPAGGHVRIYLDGSATPAVDLPFSGYFSGANAPFTHPALVYKTPGGEYPGGSNCYVPIPFQQSCRIVADSGWGLYYHFNYSLFAAGTQVPTFQRNLSAADSAELAAVNAFLTTGLGTDPAGSRAGEAALNSQVSIPAGGTATVADLAGPGAITSLKVRLPSMGRDEQTTALRELALRITWDGEAAPAVWAPLGDFFGTSPAVNPYRSLPLGMGAGEFYSFWYMPFAGGARLEIVNDGATSRSLETTVVHAPLARPAAALGRFHAKWHRDALPPADPARAIDWTLVRTQGRGRFCGAMLNVWNPRAAWWGEGDEKYFVDGEKFPSTFGTGSEDYLGYAWGQPYFFERPLHCVSLVGRDNRFHSSAARWHIAESIPFQQSFEGCIEKYQANSFPVQYSTVAYWYLAAGGQDPLGPVPVQERLGYYTEPSVFRIPGVLEGEDLPVLAKTRGYDHFQDLSFWAKDKFSGDAQLWWTGSRPGERMTVGLPVDATGDYAIAAALVKAADYGIVQLSIDGVAVGAPIDLYTSFWVIPTGPISLGTHHFTAGQHTLGVEITGANPAATKSYLFGLDYLKLAPAAGVAEWYKQ
jgi:hypothetical protein